MAAAFARRSRIYCDTGRDYDRGIGRGQCHYEAPGAGTVSLYRGAGWAVNDRGVLSGPTSGDSERRTRTGTNTDRITAGTFSPLGVCCGCSIRCGFHGLVFMVMYTVVRVCI